MMKYLLFSILILLCSCKKEEQKITSVQEFYLKKIDKLKKEQLSVCKDSATVHAERYIDKLVDKWVENKKTDTIHFPSKPIKPRKPKEIIDEYQALGK